MSIKLYKGCQMFTVDVIFQDDHFAVINKPSGVSLFADRMSPLSFWDLLKTHFKERTIYPVHRIDKDTSGVLLLAFSKNAQAQLTRQFFHHTLAKAYLAICLGQPHPATGTIDLPLCPGRKSSFRVAGQRDTIFLDKTSDTPTWRLPSSSQAFTSHRPSYPSQTLYHTHISNGQYSLVMVKPITGRTHQIRVHLCWIGHQLLGDPLYGTPKSPQQQAERLALHSFACQCTENWVSGQAPMQRIFHAPLPPFFTDALKKMDPAYALRVRDIQQDIEATLENLKHSHSW
jgi:tRNA pseudouridine32 synthase/23S rRNA pseudouridine746 synthase